MFEVQCFFLRAFRIYIFFFARVTRSNTKNRCQCLPVTRGAQILDLKKINKNWRLGACLNYCFSVTN